MKIELALFLEENTCPPTTNTKIWPIQLHCDFVNYSKVTKS